MMKLTFARLNLTLLLSTSFLLISSPLCFGKTDSTASSSSNTSEETTAPNDQPKDDPTNLDKKEETIATLAKHKAPQKKNSKTSSSSKETSMGDALTSAYQNNTEIKEQRATVRAADERIGQALAGYKPTLDADAGLRWERHIESGSELQGGVDAPGLHKQTTKAADAGLTLKQNIYKGGSDQATQTRAESGVKSERAKLMSKEQEILLSAADAYLKLYAKTSEIKYLETNLNILTETLDSTNSKFKVGEETITAVSQAEANKAEGEAKLEKAKAELEAIKATYERVTGLKPGNVAKPSEINMLPKDLATAIKRARDNNPDILSAIYQGDVAQAEIDRIHGGLRPTLDLTGGLRRSLSTTDKIFNPATDGGIDSQSRSTRDTVQSVELRARMPIYEAGMIRSQEREARQASEQRRVNIETTRRSIHEKLIQAWETYLAAKANRISYQAQVNAFEVSVEGTRQEMIVGSKILLDFLNEQQKLVNAQLNLVQAEQQYYIAAYQILAAVGLLTAKNMSLRVNYYNPEAHYTEAKYGHF